MEEVHIWIDIIQTIIIVLGLIGVGFIPKMFYEKSLERHRNKLATNITEIKNTFDKELQELRVAQENSQPQKVEGFIEFSQVIYLANDLNKLSPGKRFNDLQEEIMVSMRKFSHVVFLFGEDQTIKKFIEYREATNKLNLYNQRQDSKANDQKYYLVYLMAELMICLRKDLGNRNTETNTEDYLSILLNDWEKIKEEFLESVKRAKEQE